MRFFQAGIQNPYNSPLPSKILRFWTTTQKNYYASVLYMAQKVFPHKNIPHLDMEDIPSFNNLLQDLFHAKLLQFCSECIHWNEELVLQFYATLYVSGDPKDINTWVLDWMTQHQHYTASVPEIIANLQLPPSEASVPSTYGAPLLRDDLMNMLMKPQAPEAPPRTKFLVSELQYLPSTLYRILAKSFCPIKGYESTAEEVVGIMKNILYSLCMSAPINISDFFFRTLVDAAQNPHILKAYAPWIMKLICTKTGINFKPDLANHRPYVPLVEVLQHTLNANAKGKAPFYEEVLPQDSLGGNIRQPQSRTTHEERTHASTEETTQARLMTDRELLISLHQKVDRIHDWTKRQIGDILSYMAQMHTTQKKVHQYAHHAYQRLDALLTEVITPEDLAKLGLRQPPLLEIRPPHQFTKRKTPPLAMDSFSSAQEFSPVEVEDTAACPHTSIACLRPDSQPRGTTFGTLAIVSPFC